MKYFLAILLIYFLPHTALSQKDSSYYGSRRYFCSFQIATLGKTRSVNDSFTFGSWMYQLDVGFVLRPKKILRPYALLGINYYTHTIGSFFYDSVLLLQPLSKVYGFIFQPEIGFEISPEENWYFRLGIKAPLLLSSSFKNTFLMQQFHLLKDNNYQFQKWDTRMNVEIGKDFIHQRLDGHVSLTYGTRFLYGSGFLDKAQAVGIQAGLRYHFGTL